MTKTSGSFSHDASNRLSFEMFDVDSLDYPKLAARVVEQFHLTPSSELVVGLDECFATIPMALALLALNGTTGRASLSLPRLRVRNRLWRLSARTYLMVDFLGRPTMCGR